ncbi:MAG: hypothetical protein R3C11_20045 [Planctomycetaceae bacterium]
MLEQRTMLAAAAVPDYTEDFEDGADEGFNSGNPAYWTIADVGGNKVYEVKGTSFSGVETSVIEVPGQLSANFQLVSDVTPLAAPGQWQDGFIVFDYNSDTDFKYAGLLAGQNQWVIGHWQGNFSNRLATVDWDDTGRDIVPGQTYNLVVDVQGHQVSLSVDGELIIDTAFAGGTQLKNGQVGFMSFNARTQFDNFEVYKFNDQDPGDLIGDAADDFAFTNEAVWSIETDEAISRFFRWLTNPSLASRQLSTTWKGLPVPENFEISTNMEILGGAGLWYDGFIIFDYQSETDFKFAGTFAGQNEWVIGHYNGTFANRIAVVDWDNEARHVQAENIYDLTLTVQGNQATLFVDGEEIVSGAFDELDSLSDGGVGIMGVNTVVRFSDYTVAEAAPPVAATLIFEEDVLDLV